MAKANKFKLTILSFFLIIILALSSSAIYFSPESDPCTSPTRHTENCNIVPHILHDRQDMEAVGYATQDSEGYWSNELIDFGYILGGPAVALSKTNDIGGTYYNLDLNALRFLEKRGGEWNVETVDSYDNTFRCEPDIAYDSDGTVHIVYFHRNDGHNGELKHASKEIDGEWEIEVIDIMPQTNNIALNIDNNDNIAIGYIERTSSQSETVKFAYLRDKIWEIEIVHTNDDYGGNMISLAFDSADNPHLTWGEETPQNSFNKIIYAKRNELETWENQILYTGPGVPYSEVPSGISLAIDSGDNSHVVFGLSNLLGFPMRLNYISGKNGLWNDIESVNVHWSGASRALNPSIALDYDDNPMIVDRHFEQPETFAEIRYFTKNGVDNWDFEVASEIGGTPDLVLELNR